jgi:iron-sulfur cluster assembly accessory protein
MVTITEEAEKFITDLLDKNQKTGYGIKIYVAGFACSGPQFGMSFQEKEQDGDIIDSTAKGFKMYYDEETKKELDECVIEFIDDPNFGTGLTIRNPNFNGCASCGGGCH